VSTRSPGIICKSLMNKESAVAIAGLTVIRQK
jgi:hypothetical protein